jgi:hypothetical protein
VKLALNLEDLGRMIPEARQAFLGGKLGGMVWVDKTVKDGCAVELTCEFTDAALVCDLIRSEDRRLGRTPTRLYLFRRTWTQLSSTAVLTQVRQPDKKVVLNPDLFQPETVFIPSQPEVEGLF